MEEGKEPTQGTRFKQQSLCEAQPGEFVVNSSDWTNTWVPTKAGVLVKIEGRGYVAMPFKSAAVSFDRRRPSFCDVAIEFPDGWKILRP